MDKIIKTALRGKQLVADPLLNKGSAFSLEERKTFGLEGLLPFHVSTIEEQLKRNYENFCLKGNAVEKYIFLSALQDRNEILFYKFIQSHIPEMVPIIYTPTVGEACQRYSHIFRRARGLYLSYPQQDCMQTILKQTKTHEISIIVVTDGERILGLGDLGVGGMGIPIGKLALYILCAGIHPSQVLPIFLDVGTNRQDLLEDPLYLGWRHSRLTGKEYDEFIDRFVETIKAVYPNAVLQWEDFAKANAWRLLQRHRDRILSFNDDIQGTAAVTLSAILRSEKTSLRPIEQERIVIAGGGSAATGISSLLVKAMLENGASQDQARSAIWLIDTNGLIHAGRNDLSAEKKIVAQSLQHLESKQLNPEQPISLAQVIEKVQPTVLIGATGDPGTFNESIVRSMAQSVSCPVILPLSNPTSKSEAVPQDLLRWTDGQALIATGSPFDPVEWNGKKIPIGQCNNVFIFPGVGLGLTVSQAKKVPDEVFIAAAKAVANFDERLPGYEAMLLPNLEHVRQVAEKTAVAVASEILGKQVPTDQIASLVRENMWDPHYPKLELIQPEN